jgi:hypothetical protein
VGYLSRSMLDALNDSSLVHVHGDAFIPQGQLLELVETARFTTSSHASTLCF